MRTVNHVVRWIVAIATTLQVNVIDAAPSWLSDAQVQYKAGNYQQTLIALEGAKAAGAEAASPEDQAEADNLGAWSQYRLGELSPAAQVFQKMADSPGHKYQAASLFMTGLIAEKQGAFKDACIHYRNVLIQHPKSNSAAESGMRFSETFQKLSAADKATLVHENPKAVECALYESGRVFLEKKKDPQKAKAVLSELTAQLRQSERVPSAFLMIGKAEALEGDNVAACKQFADVVKRFPQSNAKTEALDQLGWIGMNLPEKELQKLLSENSQMMQEAVYAAGWSRLNRHEQYAEAESLFNFYVSRFPDGSKWDDALMLLGRSEIKQGKNEEALATYQRLYDSTQYNNHWNEAQAEVVRVLSAQKDWKRLKEESLKLYGYDHPRGKAYGVLSYVNACVALEESKEAISFLETTVAKHPEDPYIPYYQQRLQELKQGCCGH